MKGKGKWLEDAITRIGSAYEQQGILKIRKVDPPVRMIGTGNARRIIPMTNPFLDFVGTWTRRGGRALCIEAKSTDKTTLGIGSGGLTDNQWANLLDWRRHGAATGVLWGLNDTNEIRFVPVEAIEAQLRNGIKHIKWHHATELRQGLGFVLSDFEEALADFHPLET